MTKELSPGVVHEVPADLRKALLSEVAVVERWEDLTSLARNEWICWTITTKNPRRGKTTLSER